ncbi:MAG: hypothetical protein ACQEQW_08415 [Bacteroidota bacterium]
MKKIIIYFVILVIISPAAKGGAIERDPSLTRPEVELIKSPLGDYLYFLLCRKPHRAVPDLDSLLGIRGIPRMRVLIALPEIVTSYRIDNYSDIYRVIDSYYGGDSLSSLNKDKRISYSSVVPPAREIEELVRKGEESWPDFMKYWKQYIEPLEDQQIEVWEKQLRENDVMGNYAELTKIHLKSSRLEIAAMAFHLSGSCNFNPHGIYTSLFTRPNLPWVIGHEGTHILLSEFEAGWMSDPRVAALEQKVAGAGYRIYDLEEAVCLFMQAALARKCGTVPPDYYMHTRIQDEFMGSYIQNLEEGLDPYLKDDSMNIVDYMITTAEKTLKGNKPCLSN